MISPDAPGNIIDRGCIAALNEVFHVDLHGLIHMIEILSSNVLVFRLGGEFSPFIGARIA